MVAGLGDRDGASLFGYPVADAVAVGHDTGAGSELARELRTQPRIQLRREKKRDHRRALDIDIKHVLDAEHHAVGDAGPGGVRLGFPDALRVEVYAHPSCPEFLGGRDDDPAVAAPEVVDDIVARDAGQREHGVHDREVGRDEDHVELDGGRGPAVPARGHPRGAPGQRGCREDRPEQPGHLPVHDTSVRGNTGSATVASDWLESPGLV